MHSPNVGERFQVREGEKKMSTMDNYKTAWVVTQDASEAVERALEALTSNQDLASPEWERLEEAREAKQKAWAAFLAAETAVNEERDASDARMASDTAIYGPAE
jgi:hypothetical protein